MFNFIILPEYPYLPGIGNFNPKKVRVSLKKNSTVLKKIAPGIT